MKSRCRAIKSTLGFILLIILFILLMDLNLAFADWPCDLPGKATISRAVGDQTAPVIASDGAGGAYIVWADTRNSINATTGTDIYAQHINASGDVQWTADGLPISTQYGDEAVPKTVSDGSGGTIIIWHDSRDYASSSTDIYAQRVDEAGDFQWAADGVPVCTDSATQSETVIVGDGSGGAIIAWRDDRNSATSNLDIYAQRVSSSGTILWALNGVPVCTASNDQVGIRMTSDGLGGAVVSWSDLRYGSYDVFTQRIMPAGGMQWTANGVAVRTSDDRLWTGAILSDGAGGAIIAWTQQPANDSFFYGFGSYIYAQRVDASGAIQWGVNGQPISAADFYNAGSPSMTQNGSGGAIVAYQIAPVLSYICGLVMPNIPQLCYYVGSYHISANHFNSIGQVQWNHGISMGTGHKKPSTISDGLAGAIIVWKDFNSGNPYQIKAQRINSTGDSLWYTNGIPVCNSMDSYVSAQQINGVSDMSNGAIVTWAGKDWLSSDWDIFAKRLYADGRICDYFPWEIFYPAFIRKR